MTPLPDIHTWDERFLQNLPIGEVSYIDYKSSEWLSALDEQWRQNVSPYLSAFANYDGGYLVIGVPDPMKHGHIKPDGGVPNDLRGGIVQWLENVLPGLVDRPLDRLDINSIGPSTKDSAIRLRHSVLVIHVPPSEGAPHQARDGKYYTRHGSRLHFLGHRAVMDIAGRRKNPTLRVNAINLTWTQQDEFILSAALENTSSILARFWSVVIDLPIFVGKNTVLTHKNDPFTTTTDGLVALRVNLHSSNSPVFPLSQKLLSERLEGSLRIAGDKDTQTIPDVRFKVFADNMPVVEGSLPINTVLIRL
jgi:hypothetical protein